MNYSQHLDPMVYKFVSFLEKIGIEVRFEEINEACFLPGLCISDGKLLIDSSALKYPGDILHEAGHIAVVSPADRAALSNARILTSKQREAEEMMAIAWSYAAAKHLDIDPSIVFHEEGYKGDGKNIVSNFDEGRYFGTPMLQWCGMTVEPGRHASDGDVVYPEMKTWLRTR